jgi:hypothetical protein
VAARSRRERFSETKEKKLRGKNDERAERVAVDPVPPFDLDEVLDLRVLGDVEVLRDAADVLR